MERSGEEGGGVLLLLGCNHHPTRLGCGGTQRKGGTEKYGGRGNSVAGIRRRRRMPILLRRRIVRKMPILLRHRGVLAEVRRCCSDDYRGRRYQWLARPKNPIKGTTRLDSRLVFFPGRQYRLVRIVSCRGITTRFLERERHNR